MKSPICFKYDAFLMLQTAKDCGFYFWIDEESSKFMKELLRDLWDAVWSLKRERNQGAIVEDQDRAIQHGQEVHKMNQFLQKELPKKDLALEAKERELQSEMVKKVEELEAKDKELQAEDKGWKQRTKSWKHCKQG
jgi:hypothetical protein